MTAVATDTTNQVQAFQVLPLDQVVPSPLNTRRHFDAAALEELTESIKTHGVITPLLVRPTKDGKYEIAAGERRYRAAKKAKLESVPAIVRPMNDVEFLEVVTIENLQREDVHPLDEGLGYRRLMTDASYTVEMVAQKVGKSISYVYQRLKLAELIPQLQKAFFAEEITASHAILLARLQPKDQERVKKEELFERRWEGGGVVQRQGVAVSVRALKQWIRENIMLDLHSAPWEKDDAELLPQAGPCTTCPKRTGNAPQLFPDVQEGDTCTDPGCFAAKMTAFFDRQVAKLEKETGKPALKLSADYRGGARGQPGVLYQDRWCVAHEKCKHTQQGVVIDDARSYSSGSYRRGQVISVCVERKCKVHHGASGSGYGSSSYAAEQRRAKERAKLERQIRQSIASAVVERIPAKLVGEPLRIVADALLTRTHHEGSKWICESVGLEPKKDEYGSWDGDGPVRARIPKMTEAELIQLIVRCTIADEVTGFYGTNRFTPKLARALKLDTKPIERAMRKAAAEKKAKRAKVKSRTKSSAPRPRGKVQTSAKKGAR